MPTITFVARGIAGLEAPEQGRTEYFDKTTPGFGLRVTSAGHRSWICLYRHKGEKRRFTIGTYPQLGLADARENAEEVLWRAAKGEDPAAEKKRQRHAETFRDLAERYLDDHAKVNKRSWKADRNGWIAAISRRAISLSQTRCSVLFLTRPGGIVHQPSSPIS